MAESSLGFLFDENISSKLVTILRLLGVKGLITMERAYGTGAKDEDWIPMAAEQGYIYVTLDRMQLVDEAISQRFHDAGARAVFFSSRFAQAPKWDQAVWLLKHWRTIADATCAIPRGSIRFVHWNGTIVDNPPIRRKV